MENWGKMLITGLGLCVAYCGYSYRKLAKAAESIDTTVDNLSRNAQIDIDKSIVNAAIRSAVDREVSNQVAIASRDAVDDMRSDIGYKVKSAVEASYSTISDEVTSRIAQNVARIDESALKRDVTEKAKKAILEKFDGKLDDVLDDFNGNLRNVSRIYESIANTMTKKPEKEMTFRIG